MSRRVVVTGMGAITPIGLSVEEFWKHVHEKKLGFGEITHFDASGYKAHLAAEVHDFDPKNYMEFKEELSKKGYKFASETDTETVAHLIDDYYKNGMDFFEAVFTVVEKIEGAYALGILCREYPDTLIAVRKDCPLVVGKGEQESFIASDIPAIINHTRNVYFLENPQDGKMYEISQRDQLPGGATTRIDHIAYRSSDLEKRL